MTGLGKRARAAVGLAPLALALACGGATATETAGPPPTDRDPLPYVPTPGPEGRTGGPVALALSGGEEQARRLVPSFLEAVRDQDETRMRALLSDPLGALQRQARRGHVTMTRSQLLQRVRIYSRRVPLSPDIPVGDLVNLAALRVERAAAYWSADALPGSLRATDIVVEIPIRDLGRPPLRMLLGWHERGVMVVRPGRVPRVVAL